LESLNLEEWGAFEGVGRGYGFNCDGRFHSVLETKAGAYRGNHTHPYDQYTILLSGRGKYLRFEGGIEEVPLARGRIVVVEAGVPHILVPEEDCLTFEWWDGDFTAEDVQGIFDQLTLDRVGPDKLSRQREE